MHPVEAIHHTLIPGVLRNSSTNIVDSAKITLNDQLRIAEGVEFLFIVIGLKTAREFNQNSFEVRVFVRFPTGDLMTIVEERLFIRADDCGIDGRVASWCLTKTQPQLELLANFIGKYLGIKIREAENSCIGFRVFADIPQHTGASRDFGIEITKPKQNIHGLFTQPHPA